MSYCECCDENAAEICFGCHQDGLPQWTRVADAMPEVGEDFGAFTHSREVLVSAVDPQGGRETHHAYLQNWTDEGEPEATWRLVGRDGYNVPGDVTHWCSMPAGPA